MGHDHNHSHSISPNEALNKIFIWGIVLNITFVVGEAAIGWFINSMSLLSDAGHNLSDVASLIIALLAFKIAKASPTNKYTYGYKKSTILASLINAIILVVAVAFIVVESIEKIKNPTPIEGNVVAWVAAIGILINGITAYMFYTRKKHDLNVKGAYLHMAADTLVSVGVLLSGIIISYTGISIIDPIMGIVIACIILFSSWSILAQSIRLTLDGVPQGINIDEITSKINSVNGVEGVHHLHVWAISTTENALTAHVVVDATSDSETPRIKHDIKESLESSGITHATLEFEQPAENCHHKDC